MYPPLAPWSDVRLVVYSDASHVNLPDGVSSTYGLVVFLADSSGHLCPLSWRAGKIWRVVKSSLAAETLALQEGVEEAIYIQKLLTEMYPSCSFPIHAFVDNKSLVGAFGSTRFVDDHRLRITIGALKETLQSEVRSVSLIPGTAGDLVSGTPGSNPAFSRGTQRVSFWFEYRLPVPEHRN